MSYGHRTDTTHKDIRDGLRGCGWLVYDMAAKGCAFDLLVYAHGRLVLLDCKTPGRAGRMSDVQREWRDRGALSLVTTLDEALAEVRP